MDISIFDVNNQDSRSWTKKILIALLTDPRHWFRCRAFSDPFDLKHML